MPAIIHRFWLTHDTKSVAEAFSITNRTGETKLQFMRKGGEACQAESA